MDQQFLQQLTAYMPLIAPAGLILAIIALFWASLASRHAGHALDRIGGIDGTAADSGVASTLLRLQAELESHGLELGQLTANQQALRTQVSLCIQRVGLVRYDAFDNMGGKLSFSTALLNEHATGCVISALVARDQTRVYAKPVVEGASAFNLSEEEIQAIEQARKPGEVWDNG